MEAPSLCPGKVQGPEPKQCFPSFCDLAGGIPRRRCIGRTFARELVLLSGQCGAAGLAKEAKQMFELSRLASGDERGNGWDFRLYGLAARLIGWSHSGKIACLSDILRR